MLDQFLVLLGIACNCFGTGAYLIQTLKGEIQPNKVSFLLWALSPAVAFFAQVDQGVGVQSWMTLSVTLLPLSIFIGAFFNKKAYWKVQPFDLTCGILSLVGLVLWYVTKVGNIAIALSIVADGLASLPTLIKAYKYPETEATWPWLGSVASGVLTLVTVKTWSFQTYGFSLYYTLMLFAIYFCAQTKIGKKIKFSRLFSKSSI